MNDDDALDLATEFAEAGLGLTLQAASLSIPVVGPMVKAVQLAQKARVARECREYLTRLAVHLGADDAETVARLIAEKIDDKPIQDAIDGGFRTLMAAVSERGRRCIPALVAEYFIERRPRDRRFRSVGDALSSADDADFPVLNAIASSAVYVSPALGRRYVMASGEKPVFWVVGQGTKPGNSLCSPIYERPDRFYTVVDLLSRSGLTRSGGSTFRYAPGYAVLEFDRQDDPPFALLRKCLAAACDQSPVPVPNWCNLTGDLEAPISLEP
jgi:hypothetical protein